MTAVQEPDTVVEVNAEDTRIAINNALAAAGCTFDELAAQARSGRFDSLLSRMAWAAIGRYYGD
ncbi:hypothetical protein [Nocardia farcinica]|uniref:hypothetical protein n=1 Tax=Nocardia farcinica TaxID=37329 RepID=UPI0018941093|nr:hypothetical protein [Nocardia farcinica]MBF6189401.1 hypothetical protein [Nocardia farcinica]